MDARVPTACQSSIGAVLSGNTSLCPGSPLPRSFKPANHEIHPSEALYRLLMAYRPLSSPQRGNRLKTHSRASQGCISPFYPTSLKRSLWVQHAGERNAKVLLSIVCHCGQLRKNTFFRPGERRKKKGFSGAAPATYTLLDLLAITRAQEKTSIKGTDKSI